MARKYQEMEREIQRIEGQLLVAKQICRENLKEINRLKKQQENDPILQRTNRLLSNKSLRSAEHADQFNELLRLVHDQQTVTIEQTMRTNEQGEKDAQNSPILANLASNVAELESLFDYTKSLFTQPITSVNILDNTLSLRQIADDPASAPVNQTSSIGIHDLQKRIDLMRERLTNIDRCDNCVIQ